MKAKMHGCSLKQISRLFFDSHWKFIYLKMTDEMLIPKSQWQIINGYQEIWIFLIPAPQPAGLTQCPPYYLGWQPQCRSIMSQRWIRYLLTRHFNPFILYGVVSRLCLTWKCNLSNVSIKKVTWSNITVKISYYI